ncbi:MAG: hypothetical protein QOF02_2407 [Blastocatellia bacterium]|jgi:predicted helicase|nr:hypothetical protein [Blastocatellia bacterium]
MQTLNLKPTDKKVGEYYKALAEFKARDVSHETAVRSAFQSLLDACCSKFDWKLVPEWQIKRAQGHALRADGALVDGFRLSHGLWEAKDAADDLRKEARKKLDLGYPSENILFQAPERAILFQNGKETLDEDITKPEKLVQTLKQFFEHQKPEYANWEDAVNNFGASVPQLAHALDELIEQERKDNPRYRQAFEDFAALCRQSINPNLSDDAVEEMLIQHLLTERIFRKVFNNPDFTRRNVIAAEIEQVIDALTSHSFNRDEFLSRLDYFYRAIETTAATIDDFSQKQEFLNAVYEKFFQGFSVKVADTHGIVYTPQPIVSFMVKSVEDILQKEFGKSLSAPGVHILDPFVGTGNFIVRVMQEIKKTALEQKYRHELHCNEVMLLPYYIASMNIEHEYFELTRSYEPFQGICLVDTFELAEGAQTQLSFMTPANTARVERQKRSPITVIIGNPPYNTNQQNENDNNKNRKYKQMDKRVSETYAKDSKATLVNKLNDPYVKAIRWASDRINDEGIIAFITNNSFLEQLAFDGMRKHLHQDFNRIYAFNLQGNIRKDSMRDGIALGEKNTIFGLSAMVGIAITFFIKSKSLSDHKIFYSEVDFRSTRNEKFILLENTGSRSHLNWSELQPDVKQTWLTEDLQADFDSYIPLGLKEGKAAKSSNIEAIFKSYSLGVSTNRDSVVYDFDLDNLLRRVNQFCDDYNSEVSRYQQKGKPTNIDDFIKYDRIKWSRNLKRDLKNGKLLSYDPSNIRIGIYRPFTKKFIYLAETIIDELGKNKLFFPTLDAESENRFICVTSPGSEKPFLALLSNTIPDLHLSSPGTGAQCFPFYIYNADGTHRRENITDWALAQFRERYGDASITKWDIFHYVYSLLHHPLYRERYAANLKRELPRIPFAPDFQHFAQAGARLSELHVNYKQQPEYPLERIEQPGRVLDWRVSKMKLSKDKRSLIYNDFLTLGGIPPAAFEYRLGNRSALEWIIDQYQTTTDKRSGITNDPNRPADPQYILRLIGQVITVSLETVQLVRALPGLGLSEN